jgi:putative integral membrane protein (TIGR02587 family)
VAGIVVLLVLNRIALMEPLDSVLGKIVVQTVPLSLGASVANVVFSPRRSREGDEDDSGQADVGRRTLNDLGATMAGGVFLGFSIAPTEEVQLLAAELTPGHQLMLILLSILISYAIVFVSGFDSQHIRRRRPRGIFQGPVSETAMAYLVSLLVSLTALFLLVGIDAGDPIASITAQTLVLGLPVAIGGAAGRIVI